VAGLDFPILQCLKSIETQDSISRSTHRNTEGAPGSEVWYLGLGVALPMSSSTKRHTSAIILSADVPDQT
jgi:hypothetical protein